MKARPAALKMRMAQEEDSIYLKKWLSDPEALKGFPMLGEKEIDDAVQIWGNYNKLHSGLTALWNGVPCGTAVLYIQSFQKLSHTCLFSIIVAEDKRGLGIGFALLEDLIALARNSFHIEILHLEVYEGNPAIHLYKKMGFEVYGEQKNFSLEDGKYRSKVFMQKNLKQT